MEVAAETAVQVGDPKWVAGSLVDRPLREFDRSWAGTGAAGELGGPCAQPTKVGAHEVGGVRHQLPQFERPLHVGVRLDEGEDRLGAGARLDRCDEGVGVATGGSPVHGQLRLSGGAATLEFLGEPAVDPLPLAGQDGGVHGLGEQRVAEPEAVPVGDEQRLVRPRRPQGLVQVAVREPRQRPQQRVPDLTPRRRDQPNQIASGPIECGEAVQQQVPHASRQCLPRSAGRQQLLGEERVPRSTGDDGVQYGRSRSCVGSSVEQRSHIGIGQRREIEHERSLATAHTIGQPEHALRLPGLGRATRRHEHQRQIHHVVSQEDDEVERRRVGPVEILQDDQQRDDRCPLREHRQRRLEHVQLRSSTTFAERVPERTQGVDERLERQLHPDDVDRPAEQHLETRGPAAEATSAASRDLPMPASPVTSTVAPRPWPAMSRRSTTPANSLCRVPRRHRCRMPMARGPSRTWTGTARRSRSAIGRE